MGSQLNPLEQIPTDKLGNRGGTVSPLYGERTPVMYHLFETEMENISAFNNQALFCFSAGTFVLNIILAILINWAFVSSPLSDFVRTLLPKMVILFGFIALCCYGFGGWALWKKRSTIAQIKRETKTMPPNNQAAS
jgi:hypothetical protein